MKQLSQSDHQVSFTSLAKKLDEVKIERTIMEEKAKKEKQRKGSDKLEAVQWFDYSNFKMPQKYRDFSDKSSDK